jgi:hypothetical protein
VSLFLQLKVSDENNSKLESIDLSSFEIQFDPCCYNSQAGIWKDDSQLGYAYDPSYGLAKISTFSQIWFPIVCCAIDLRGFESKNMFNNVQTTY